MNLDDNISKRIRAYLDNEMSSIERLNFEKELSNNQELMDTVSILKKMDTVYSDTDWDLYSGNLSDLKETSNLFKGEDITAFSNQVKTAESNYYQPDRKKFKSFIKYASSIAAAVLILFSGYYFLNKAPTSLDLYNDYYNLKDLPSFTTKSNTENSLSKAENLFKTKHYKEALEMFIAIESKNKNTYNPNLNLYIAICYLELNHYDLALKKLDVLLQSNTLDFHKAYWFKSLTYLKEGNKSQAREVLQLLVKDEKHFNYKNAKELLKKLN
ncbi:hypothetical protein [uncultured Lacinutrix sp.]|uniref:tetratricopeptide repeat protein n=1 Tax=uncultured Lacinutrix sp. TaxID=574032 RepID=UPI0026108DF7|nr:hypothetical protein [uncultured Lacinutrix sp.]